VFNHPHVQLALDLQQWAQNANSGGNAGGMNLYTKLFRTIASTRTPYLFACLLHQEFRGLRRNALRTMMRTFYNFKSGDFPVEDVVDMLGFDDEEEAVEMLEYHGIPCGIDEASGKMCAIVGKIMDNGKMRFQSFIGLFDFLVLFFFLILILHFFIAFE
jgi:hypothetical protein